MPGSRGWPRPARPGHGSACPSSLRKRAIGRPRVENAIMRQLLSPFAVLITSVAVAMIVMLASVADAQQSDEAQVEPEADEHRADDSDEEGVLVLPAAERE